MNIYYVVDLDTREIVLPSRRLTARTADNLAAERVRKTGHHVAVAVVRKVFQPG